MLETFFCELEKEFCCLNEIPFDVSVLKPTSRVHGASILSSETKDDGHYTSRLLHGLHGQLTIASVHSTGGPGLHHSFLCVLFFVLFLLFCFLVA